MLLDILTHPFMLGVVYPVLVIGGIVALLLPKQTEITYKAEVYTPINNASCAVTQALPIVKPNYGGHYDTFDSKREPARIGDELERKMIARVIAYNFLLELAQEARQREQAIREAFNNKHKLALCA